MSDLTREEKIESLTNWCVRHSCEDLAHCRIYDICHQYPGSWLEQSDEVIDKVFEALWEGNVDIHDLSKEHIVNPQCEVNMLDEDKINTASQTLSPNDIRKATEGFTLTFKSKDGDWKNLGQLVGIESLEPKDVSQKAKADAGKAEIRLVPMEIVWAIAWIRMYGNRKYGDPENWKTVEPERYRDALMRHLLAYISDPKSVDEESGYPHLWHAACNMAFLIHMDYGPMAYFDWNEEQWKKVMEDGHE